MLLPAMRLPYGISNFAEIRRTGFAYADKTSFIPKLEAPEKGRHYLVFLRPRRMGKTLLVSMLEHYYDVLSAPRFDALFGGLAIADAPTEDRGRYAVLRLEMTGMRTDEGVDALREVFLMRLHNSIHDFLNRHRERIPEARHAFDQGVSTEAPASLMNRFLQAMRLSPHPLYILIDEYDNFTNTSGSPITRSARSTGRPSPGCSTTWPTSGSIAWTSTRRSKRWGGAAISVPS